MPKSKTDPTPLHFQQIGRAVMTHLDKCAQHDGAYFERVDPQTRKAILQFIVSLLRVTSVQNPSHTVHTLSARYQRLSEQVKF